MDTTIVALHPEVLDALNATIAEAHARGMRVALHSGFRSQEQQDRIYALGRTIVNPDGKSQAKPMGNIVTKSKAWESWHNFGLAGDIVFKDEKGNWTWSKSAQEWAALGLVGKMFGLTWGGDWAKFPDYPHFQKTGKIKTHIEAKAILMEKGRDALWALV